MPKKKSNTPKRKMTITRRPILIIVIILAIAAIALVVAKILTNSAADESSQPNNTTSEVTTQTNPLGENNSSSTSTDESVSNKTPKQYEGDNANSSSTITGAITYAEVSGTDLIIRTTIDQELPTSATCVLTATNGNNSITETSEVINNPSSSSCKGFTIPTARLDSGTWQLEIKINTDSKSGTIKGEVNI